ncbi:MAG: EI24 domain-containing protein [Mariprofundaceae bacterium]
MMKGGLTFFAGLRLLLSESSLRAVLWRMLALLAVLMVLLMAGVFTLAEYIASIWLPEGDAWYWALLSWLVWGLAALLSILTGVVSFTILGSAAIAPWLDVLAARSESLKGYVGQESEAVWWKQCLVSLSNSVRPLLTLLAWGMLAFVLFWIPLIGQLLATVIWTYAGVRFLCFELIDTPASRKQLDYKQRKLVLNKQRFYWLGFGGVAMLIMMVPILNLLVIPAAVVALSSELGEPLA